MCHHDVHNFHKDGHCRGLFLHHVNALMSLRLGGLHSCVCSRCSLYFLCGDLMPSTNDTLFMIGCGIGVLLCMVWVLAILLVCGVCGIPECKETIFVCATMSCHLSFFGLVTNFLHQEIPCIMGDKNIYSNGCN